jgi:uncharacterized protein (TIGR00369 family)
VSDKPEFNHDPDPENPGWFHWRLLDETRFNGQILGKMIVRLDDDGRARTRVYPGHRHTNLMDNLHGGLTLSLIDVALFSSSRMFGLIEAGTSVTLDLSVQFIGAGRAGVPLDAVTELLKETRRLLFLRGIVEQEGEMVAAYSGTIRKPSARKDS